jgi:peptide/nickel transport system substrate-binding protein
MNRWIENAANAKSLVGTARFTEVDKYTVQIKMEKGSPYLNQMIGGLGQHASIMPKSAVDNVDAKTGLLKDYIGTGPYVFDSWVPDQYIKIVKSKTYQPYGTEGDYSGWAGYKHAYIDTIVFDLVTDANTVISGVQTGQYDLASSVSFDNYDLFAKDSNFYIASEESNESALIFNKKHGWGANAKFRQGMQALINVDEIMLAAYGNPVFYSNYSSYMFKSQSDWFTEKGSQYYNVHNTDQALKLFAEAGFTKNDTFILLVASDSPDFKAMATVIQSEMRAAGLKCDLLVYDWSTFVDIRNNQPDKYDAFITSFSPKVIPNMQLFLSPSWAGWCTDPRIQTDLANIGTSTDLAAAHQTWYDLQEYMLAESVPVAKFGTSIYWSPVNKKVQGVTMFSWPIFVDAKIVE